MSQSQTAELNKTASQLLASGKGILAADESMNTVGKRFAAINLENTEDNRRAFRHMLLTAPNEGQYISGVILFDETIRQNDVDGRPFVSVLQQAGIVPGIKVDQGLADFNGSDGEKVTKGLDGLPARLEEYAALGAKFAKWRSVITIGLNLPSEANIAQNAKDLAAYALACQQAGLVPIVEPEVLMDGSHSQADCAAASEKILRALFAELAAAGVAPEGLILKTNMAVPGKSSGQTATPAEVAQTTLAVFNAVLPKTLAGVVFLSGGQGELEATANLNAMHQDGPLAWPLTFSYARALQDGATRAWQGKPDNLAAAQRVFLHRAKMNGLASLGRYSPQLEDGFAPQGAATASQD
ncbi:MAG TPA: class I fructose-bisphosphate aldolase [Patescibacteria group bacterium]|nr:class I fructose-bisphosphate aldolase [Patescibacteria group bacterium]